MNITDAKGFRTPDEAYFNYLYAVNPGRQQISPIIVIQNSEVNAYNYWGDVDNLNIPDDTLILHAWPGEWRTDVFAYSFKDFKENKKILLKNIK